VGGKKKKPSCEILGSLKREKTWAIDRQGKWSLLIEEKKRKEEETPATKFEGKSGRRKEK